MKAPVSPRACGAEEGARRFAGGAHHSFRRGVWGGGRPAPRWWWEPCKSVPLTPHSPRTFRCNSPLPNQTPSTRFFSPSLDRHRPPRDSSLAILMYHLSNPLIILFSNNGQPYMGHLQSAVYRFPECDRTCVGKRSINIQEIKVGPGVGFSRPKFKKKAVW